MGQSSHDGEGSHAYKIGGCSFRYTEGDAFTRYAKAFRDLFGKNERVDFSPAALAEFAERERAAALSESRPAEPVAWRCTDLILHKTAVVEITEDAELADIRRKAVMDGKPCWKVEPLYSAPRSMEGPAEVSHADVEKILAADPWLERLTADDSPLGRMVELVQRNSIADGARQASAACAVHWRDLRRQLALRATPVADATRLHAAVLTTLERLVPEDPAPDSTEGRILVALAAAVEEYEKAKWPIAGHQQQEAKP